MLVVRQRNSRRVKVCFEEKEKGLLLSLYSRNECPFILEYAHGLNECLQPSNLRQDEAFALSDFRVTDNVKTSVPTVLSTAELLDDGISPANLLYPL